MSDSNIRNITLNDQQSKELLEEFDLGKLFYVFRKNLLTFLILAIVVVTSVWVFFRYTKPVYEASSLLKLELKSSTELLNLDLGLFSNGIDAVNLAGEIELIRSPLIYQDVIKFANLGIEYYLRGDILTEERYKNLPFKMDFHLKNKDLYNVNINLEFAAEGYTLQYERWGSMGETGVIPYGQLFENDDFSVSLSLLQQGIWTDAPLFLFIVRNEAYLYQYIDEHLEVAVENQAANTIRLTFRDHNPSKCVAILDGINQSYLEKTVEHKNRVYEQSIGYLNYQLQLVSDTIGRLEEQLTPYADQGELPEKGEMAAKLEKEDLLIEQRSKLLFKRQQYAHLEEVLRKDSIGQAMGVGLTLGDPQLSQLLQQISVISNRATRITGSYRETTTAYQKAIAELSDIKTQILDVLTYKKVELSRELNYLNEDLNALKDELSQTFEEDSELKRLNRAYGFYDNISNVILTKKIEIEVAKAGTIANFRTLSPASALPSPIYPVPLTIYAVSAVAYLVICFVVLLLGYIGENKINNLRELERMVEVPVLGIVPAAKSRMNVSKMLVSGQPKSVMSEAFRAIRTNLEFIAQGKKKRVISVTSTVSSEGKTFVALNLAGVIGMTGQKVIILDLDLRKPKIHMAFDANNQMGVSSVLIGQAEWQACVNHTDIPTLDYITSGPIPPNPSELLMSDAFDVLINSLQQQYDVIVCDTAPVGLVTDAIMVMKKATVPLYVFRAGVSEQHFVNSINGLAATNRFKVSAILNGVDFDKHYGYGRSYGQRYSYGYSYVYGKGYGEYYGESSKETSWWKKLMKWKS